MLMRAISVRQPWAWLLLHKGKDVENRSWALPARYVGDPLLLHAGKTEAPVPPELRPLLTEYDGRLGGVVGPSAPLRKGTLPAGRNQVHATGPSCGRSLCRSSPAAGGWAFSRWTTRFPLRL